MSSSEDFNSEDGISVRKAGVKLADEERDVLRELIREAGGDPKQFARIAKAAGVSISTVRREVEKMLAAGINLPLASPRQPKSPTKRKRSAQSAAAPRTSKHTTAAIPSSATASNTHGIIVQALYNMADWVRKLFRPAA